MQGWVKALGIVCTEVDGWSSERADLFLALCLEFDLVVSNTFGHCKENLGRV